MDELSWLFLFFFQAEDGIRCGTVTGVQTCALPIYRVTAGVFGSNTQLGTTGNLTTGNNAIVVDPTGRTLATTVLGTGLAGTAVAAAGAVGAGVFGLAVQTKDFAALIQFLESQGNV